MIYDLDEILKQKLTKDDESKKTYDNLKGLYATGVVELRYYGVERDIKLNRLERRAEPTAPILKQEPPCYDGGLVCPSCGKPITNVWSSRTYQPHFCHFCGQALKWEV